MVCIVVRRPYYHQYVHVCIPGYLGELCINMIFLIGCRCRPAAEMLQSNGDLKRKWTWAIEWLNDELERVCPL